MQLAILRFLYRHTFRFTRLNNMIWYRKHTVFLRTCGDQSKYGW